MDNTDIKIINILQANCKTSTHEIGQQVGLTAPAVAERINRLKDAGVIEGFHAKINDALMGNHICAFVLINVPPKSYESLKVSADSARKRRLLWSTATLWD